MEWNFFALGVYEIWRFLNGKISFHIFARKISLVALRRTPCMRVYTARCPVPRLFCLLDSMCTRAHVHTILPHSCDLLPTASSSTCSHSSWLSSYCGVSLPAAGTRTHPMSGATDTDKRGSPLLCAMLLIRVPRDVPAKLRSRRLCEISDSWGSSWYRMLYITDEVWKFTFTVIYTVHF